MSNHMCQNSMMIIKITYSYLSLNAKLGVVLGVLVVISAMGSTRSEVNVDRNEENKFMAVHVFGDSIVDTGNNNGLATIVKSDFPPYGRDFKDGKPTGRFCNGKLLSDFIVEAFGIKEFLPSYHDPNLQTKDLQTGLSFASAGSGYDPFTSKLLQVYTQREEIQFFEEYIEKLKRAVGEEQTKTIIEKSLYFVSSGSNDILISYFGSRIRKLHFDFPSYADLLLKHASHFLTELYNHGARRIAVLNVGPLGCTPFGRTIEGGMHRDCSEKINKAVQLFNAKLSSQIASLNRQLSGCKIVIVDAYNPVLNVLRNPHKFGFEELGKGCCSTGTLETGLLCNKFSPTCTNASAYMFWDSVHPSESAYRTLFPAVINQIVFV